MAIQSIICHADIYTLLILIFYHLFTVALIFHIHKLTFPSASSFAKSNGSLVIQYLHNLKLYLISENFTYKHKIFIYCIFSCRSMLVQPLNIETSKQIQDNKI
jgi:hypothetical protein